MKGVVFNLLEEVVRREHGEDTWGAVLGQAGVDGSSTSHTRCMHRGDARCGFRIALRPAT